jgi:hypothetical protein
MGINYIPISSKAKLPEALKQIDKNFREISAENQTKTISQNGGTAMQLGKLKNRTYGLLLSDPNNIPRILVGFHTDGKPVIAVSVSGIDVVSALGE